MNIYSYYIILLLHCLILSISSTSIFGAAIRNDVTLLRKLLTTNTNIDINAIDKRTGLTAVYFASQLGHVDVITELHLHHARLDIPTQDGRTPGYVAAENGHLQVLELLAKLGGSKVILIPRNDGRSSIHAAAMKGHLSIINTLVLNHGQNVNVQTNIGGTALYVAAHFGHLNTVVQLHSLGADLNMAKKDGTTPVFVCAQQGYIELVKKLQELGAAMDVPDQDGFTPLFAAAQHEQKDIAQVLVELGADVKKALRDTKEKQHPAAYQILKEIYESKSKEKEKNEETNNNCDFDSINYNSLTPEQFQEKYLHQNKPVLLKNAMRHMPAMHKWTHAYLSQQLRHVSNLEDMPVMNNATEKQTTGLPLVLYGDNYLFCALFEHNKCQTRSGKQTRNPHVTEKEKTTIEQNQDWNNRIGKENELAPFQNGDILPLSLFESWNATGQLNRFFMIGNNNSGT